MPKVGVAQIALPMTVAQVKRLLDGEKVDEIEGVVASVGDRYGDHYGDVPKQHFTLRDQTGSIDCVAVCHQDLSPYEGSNIHVRSTKAGNGHVHGIYVHRIKNGFWRKETVRLKITGQAEINFPPKDIGQPQ